MTATTNPTWARWLARDPDPQTRAELQTLMAEAPGALEDHFRGRLAFGTAGLRGLFGPGPNRMNRLVVREATVGLGRTLRNTVAEAVQRGVVVGYDGRRMSREFAHDAAAVLAALGFKVHLFDRELPTPVAAFAVKHLRAAAGIVITASHNPPDYNGYKVYWEHGAQIVSPIDEAIAGAIATAAQEDALPWMSLDEARAQGRVHDLGDAMIEQYLSGVAALSVHPAVPERKTLRLAYTPLHGVGARVAEAALARAGFTNVFTVAEQREPDGEFPTVKFPNPEEPGAMDLVLALARRERADLVLANDPDADRLAVALRTPSGDYQMLTGDQVGVLLGDDLMRAWPDEAVVATTIVSSRMLGVIARSRGVDYFETLTGFKWIAAGALERRARGQRFVFGYEEALGYTIDDLVRCKDGVSAVVAFAELAADCAHHGVTVLERLEALYRKYGLFLTAQKSLALTPGMSVGAQLRAHPPRTVAGRAVEAVDDLAYGTHVTRAGESRKLELPKSDVLVYHLAGDARVIVRPSGTEPKLKCYYEVREDVREGEAMSEALGRGRAGLEALIGAHQGEIAGL